MKKKNEENKFLEIYLSIIENEKKKFSVETVFGLLSKLYCEKNIYFVLQGWNCIAIEVGWLLGDLEILLQYNYCIAGEGW